MKTLIRKIRGRLGLWIYPKSESGVFSNPDFIKDLRISSHSLDGKIPIPHYEEVMSKLFSLTTDNVIFRIEGKKVGSMFETKIFYIPRQNLIL